MPGILGARGCTIGIAGCCALAANGHVAAPLTNVMNSRRLILAPRLEADMVTIGTGSKKGVNSCPLWVKSRHSAIFDACPLYPRKETLRSGTSMSALCQKRTHAVQHKLQRRGNVRKGGPKPRTAERPS